MILLPNCTGDTATERVGAAHKKVLDLKKEKNLPYHSSISYGVIEVGDDNIPEAEVLLSQADKLMYEFKMHQLETIK